MNTKERKQAVDRLEYAEALLVSLRLEHINYGQRVMNDIKKGLEFISDAKQQLEPEWKVIHSHE